MSQPRDAAFAYVIVPAGPADAEALAHVHVAAWRETYRGLLADAFLARMSEPGYVRRFRRELTQPASGAVTLLAANPYGPFGYVCGGPARSGTPGEAEVALLYLLRSGQGRGVGKRLLQAAARALQAQGATSLVISVLRENAAARGFYERLGGRLSAPRLEAGPGGPAWVVSYRWPKIDELLR